MLDIFALFHLIRKTRDWYRSNTQQQISIEVSVVEIDSEISMFVSGGYRTLSINTNPEAAVTFESISDGDMKRLCIPESKFKKNEKFSEGDTGTLTFQGTRFISFKKSS